MRVLVVEDDCSVGTLVCDLLARAGHSALLAVDLSSAREILNEGVDAVILDLMLAGESGLDLVPEISGDVLLIMASGYTLEYFDLEKILETRPSCHFLQKPWRLGELREILGGGV